MLAYIQLIVAKHQQFATTANSITLIGSSSSLCSRSVPWKANGLRMWFLELRVLRCPVPNGTFPVFV